jgi:hypothetical protein
MSEKYDAINKALDIDAEIVETKKEVVKKVERPDDPQKDYEYSRGQLYNLIEKGQEALSGIIELAQETESPRAFEVAGQLVKSVGDVTDKLLDLQKKMKDLDAPTKNGPQTVNNALFVGSTKELQKLLKQGVLNNTTDTE